MHHRGLRKQITLRAMDHSRLVFAVVLCALVGASAADEVEIDATGVATAPSGASAGDGSTPGDVLGEVLLAEISATEEAVRLQQAKVDALQRLRQHVAARVAAGRDVDLGDVRKLIERAVSLRFRTHPQPASVHFACRGS